MVTGSVVAAGGAVGSAGRYALSLAGPGGHGFPWPTLVVNLVGALALGVLAGALSRRPTASPLLRPFLGTGVLGGFTTFSALTVEVADRTGTGHALLAATYLAVTLVGGVALALVGVAVGERTR